MRIQELVRLAVSRLGTSRLRSALTMLGIIIGVASVVRARRRGPGRVHGHHRPDHEPRDEPADGQRRCRVQRRRTPGGRLRDDAHPRRRGGGGDGRRRRRGVPRALDLCVRRGRRQQHHDHDPRHHRGLPRGPRLRAVAGQLPHRHRGGAGAPSRRPRGDHGGRPRPRRRRDRQRHLDRRDPVRGRRDPPGEGNDEQHERRRPGPHPGHHDQALLHGLRVVGPVDRRERRLGRRDGDRRRPS